MADDCVKKTKLWPLVVVNMCADTNTVHYVSNMLNKKQYL